MNFAQGLALWIFLQLPILMLLLPSLRSNAEHFFPRYAAANFILACIALGLYAASELIVNWRALGEM